MCHAGQSKLEKQMFIAMRRWCACILCLLGSIGSSVAGTGLAAVSHRTLADGVVEFQIRETEVPPSALGLYDVRTGKEAARISDIVHSEPRGLYVARLAKSPPEGVYEIKIFDAKGSELGISRPPIITPQERLTSIRTSLDRRKGVVSWGPEQTSLNRVNAGFSGGMFIGTLKSWHFSAAVNSSVPWDFWDEDHVADYRNARGLRVVARSVPLPAYLLVIGQPLYEDYMKLPLFAGLSMLDPEYGFEVSVDSDKHRKVDFLPGKKVVELSPGSAVRISLDQVGRDVLASKRYEILFYMNGQFFYEEPEASDPYTFIWPAEEMGEGFQVLTVNVMSYNIGYASRTIPVWLVRPTPGQPPEGSEQ